MLHTQGILYVSFRIFSTNYDKLITIEIKLQINHLQELYLNCNVKTAYRVHLFNFKE